MKTKNIKQKIIPIIIITILLLASAATFVPQTKAITQPAFINALWVQQTTELTSNPTVFWNHFDATGCNAIYYGNFGGGWDANGYMYYGESNSAITSFLTAIHNHNSSILVFFDNYADDSNAPAVTNSVVRNRMASEINSMFQTSFGGNYFNGYIDDLEYNNGFIGNVSGLISWWQQLATTANNNGKLSAVYYGMHNWQSGETADRTILPTFTVSFVNPVWNVTDTQVVSWSTTGPKETVFYNDMALCSVPWQFQARAFNDNTAYTAGGILADFTYFYAKFTNGMPNNFYGFSFWANSVINSTEWTSINTNLPNFGGNINPTPPPQPLTFGYTSYPTASVTFDPGTSRLRGSPATPTANGNIMNISAYLKASSGATVNAETALYTVASNSLVGASTQLSITLTSSYQLYNFSFASPIAVANGVQYYILIWVNNTSAQTIYLGVGPSGGLSDYYSDSYVYGVTGQFPTTIALTQTTTNTDCIYAYSADSYTITVYSPYGTPTVNSTVTIGSSYYTAVSSPDLEGIYIYICSGYTIDNGTLTTGTSYTFTNIQANHTITFSWVATLAPTPTPTPNPTSQPTSTPNVIIQTQSQTLYFTPATTSTLGINGYALASSYTNNAQTVSNTYTGTNVVTYSYQIYLYSSPTQLTLLPGSGSASVVSVNGNYTNAVTSIINIPQTAVLLGYNALEINIIENNVNGGSTVVATFVSPVLITNYIMPSAWLFTLYINNTQVGGNTYSSIMFGNSQYPSSITGISLSVPLRSDIVMWDFSRGDYIGAMLYEYMAETFTAFYAIILFAVAGTLYWRYKHTGIIVYFFALLASGGILYQVLPIWAATVAAAILLLAGTFLIYRVVR